MTERDVHLHGESPEPHRADHVTEPLEDDMPMQALAEALRAPGTVDELVREKATVSAFVAERRALATTLTAVGPGRRSARRTAAIVTGTAAAVLLVGGVAAAATGSLPAPLQRLAHTVVGAPAPDTDQTTASSRPSGAAGTDATASASGAAHAAPTTSASPAGATPAPSTSPSHLPSAATGPGAVGLCAAFLKDSKPVAAKEHSQAYAALVSAAAAHGQTVSAFCGAVAGTSPTPTPTPSASTSHGAKPTAPPGQVKKSASPTASPTGNGTGNGNGKGNGSQKPKA